MAAKQNNDYIFRNMKVYSSTEWLADNKNVWEPFTKYLFEEVVVIPQSFTLG